MTKLCRHKPTGHSFRVVRVVDGQFVDLQDIEGTRPKRVQWADWINCDVWEKLP